MLPQPLRSALEALLGSPIAHANELGGGCISHATQLDTADGERIFLKWGARGEFERGLFGAEAEALAALAGTEQVRVPAVRGVEDDAQFNWLLLEWLEPGRATQEGWQELGRALARLHRTQNDAFGWPRANFIGSLPQHNDWSRDWPSFWRDRRIVPQMRGLRDKDRRRVETLLRHADAILAMGNEEGASLLHGDLWGGNVHALADGSCALIDPSAYYGHREVDLAMASLFGGFTKDFFDAYAEEWPLQPGFDQRRYLYQLYYMLVHVNLFGASYLAGTLALLSKLGF